MASIAPSLGGWRLTRFAGAAEQSAVPAVTPAVTMEEAARLSPLWAHVEVPSAAEAGIQFPPMFSDSSNPSWRVA